MTLFEAKELALRLMISHKLTDWRFEFNNRKGAFGVCSYSKKTIYLSRITTPQMTDKAVINTILHEIAHALVGAGHGYNYVWRRKAIEIGCDGSRCNHYEEVNIRYKYIAVCPCCGKEIGANRKPKRSHWCRCTGRTFRPQDKLNYIQQY
jgi:predicted SprT family Zn-dependent metalloprotease